MRKYCRGCNTHQEHKVSLYKASKQRLSAKGKRRYDRKKAGYGSQPKPIQHNQVKTTKKVVLILTCNECGTKNMISEGRLKKIEIVQ